MSDPVAPLPSAPADESSESAGSALARLAIGPASQLAIVGFSLYAARKSALPWDEQARCRNGIASTRLQIVRIQQNLSSVAGALRDMLGGTEPYPLAAWANTFTRPHRSRAGPGAGARAGAGRPPHG